MLQSLKTLRASLRENGRIAVIAVLFAAMGAVCECILPFVMAKLIDSSGVDWRDIAVYGAALAVLAAAALVFGVFAGRWSARASAGFAANLREDMFVRVQGFSFSEIDKFSAASLVTRMTTDITNVQNAFNMIICAAVRVPVMMVFSVVMSFVISPHLAWIFLACVPVLGGIIVFIVSRATPVFNRVFKKYDALNESVNENVRAIRVVKTYVREDYENEKFARAADDVCRDFVRAERIVAWNTPLMNFFVFLCYVPISALGALIITGTLGWGTLTTGELSSLISYGISILAALMMLGMIIVMITMSIASANRIAEVLCEESSLTSPPDGAVLFRDGSVDFDDVSFRYAADAERDVLEHIDLHVASGETLGILGGTGSAKSSLVSFISRLYDATGGSVKVGGRDVREYDPDALRRSLTVVLQDTNLFTGTVKENIRYGRQSATDEEVVAAAKTANAYDFIVKLPQGFDTVLTGDGANLSQGQRRLLSIARAAVADMPVLILDEATSSIDTRTEKIVQAGTDRLMEGRTTFVIVHRLSTVRSSDCILVLDHGRVVEQGSHEELIARRGAYHRLYTGAAELE